MSEDNQIGVAQVRKSGLKMVWRSFGSIRITIALLTVIILTCILGTLIPQNAGEEFYLSRYGLRLYKLLQFTDIIDLYQSRWFVALLSLLALNLLACTVTRASLKPSPVGQILAHLGAIIILVSVIISTIWREIGFMQIYEGMATDTFVTEDRERREKTKSLDFKLYLDDFIIEHYGDDPASAIRDYKSELKIIDRGKIAAAKTIEVNHPLRYRGYTFYQHSYDSKNLRYTVLQVVKDPGVPLVYVGFVLLVLGLTFTFVVTPLTKQDKQQNLRKKP